jgi:cell division protein FtsB
MIALIDQRRYNEFLMGPDFESRILILCCRRTGSFSPKLDPRSINAREQPTFTNKRNVVPCSPAFLAIVAILGVLIFQSTLIAARLQRNAEFEKQVAEEQQRGRDLRQKIEKLKGVERRLQHDWRRPEFPAPRYIDPIPNRGALYRNVG